MMKSLKLVCLVLLGVFVFISCNNNGGGGSSTTTLIGPEGGVARSSDGRLTLTFPAGAVDEETAITVRKLNQGELPPDSNGYLADMGYELGPDGLEFAEPVEVSFLIDDRPNAADGSIVSPMPVLFYVDGGMAEALDDLSTEIDSDVDTITTFGTLMHFSNVANYKVGGVIYRTIGIPDEGAPGTSFDVHSTISVPPDGGPPSISVLEYLDQSTGGVALSTPVAEIPFVFEEGIDAFVADLSFDCLELFATAGLVAAMELTFSGPPPFIDPTLTPGEQIEQYAFILFKSIDKSADGTVTEPPDGGPTLGPAPTQTPAPGEDDGLMVEVTPESIDATVNPGAGDCFREFASLFIIPRINNGSEFDFVDLSFVPSDGWIDLDPGPPTIFPTTPPVTLSVKFNCNAVTLVPQTLNGNIDVEFIRNDGFIYQRDISVRVRLR